MAHKYNSLITAKNVGIVTILCAATATIIILNQPQSKRKYKKQKHKKLSNRYSIKQSALATIQLDLESRRQKILNEFEQSSHKKIPKEMDATMDYICNDIGSPDLYPPKIRLLCSQLIQDYAIMYTNIHNSSNVAPQIITLAKEWLAFNAAADIALQIEQINHRYALALRSKSIKEFKQLYSWLQSGIDKGIVQKESVKQNWILRNFQCCCLLGLWPRVKHYGMELENISPQSLSVSNGKDSLSKDTTPLHPLHLFEYIALKLPNQSANFTQVYYNVDTYMDKFDTLLSPPLRFSEWQIKNCKTVLTFGFSTEQKRNAELTEQINGKNSTTYDNNHSFMFVYGCLVQFPCFWVQLPASNTKMQPVVLTGPYNDSEMELTASYIRRVSGGARGNGNGQIKVVRSDLRLKLDRRKPWDGVTDGREESKVSSSNNNKKWNGWNWNGTFEHLEGLLQCNESDLNNFAFRRRMDWKAKALKFTCREWNCHMVISTPD